MNIFLEDLKLPSDSLVINDIFYNVPPPPFFFFIFYYCFILKFLSEVDNGDKNIRL